MIRNFLAAALLFSGPPAGAETLLGPRDVWPTYEYGHCDSYQVDLACLGRSGAPEGALRFIRVAAADPEIGMLVIPTRFTELGAVDLIEVDIPGMANTNWQQMLVNGDPSIVWLANWSAHQPGGDAGTRAVLRRYPQAFPAGRVVVQGHRKLPGGVQRFVMADMLVDGCRACDPVGSAIFQLEFKDGDFLSFSDFGWVLAEGEGSTAQMQADLRRGDIALLQTLLNLHGFQAWSMDGRVGPDTRAALDKFKAEHCLASEDDLSPGVVAALTAPGPYFATPPCAMAQRPRLEAPLGLPDGTYVTNDAYCTEEGRAAVGDVSYSGVVRLKADSFAFSESGCTILSATPQGADLDLGMVCSAEGMDHDRFETVTVLPPDTFRWRDETFRLCGRAVVPPKVQPASPPAEPPAAVGPVFPLKDAKARVNAIFGAAGPGPMSDPTAYFSGQYHVGVDLRAAAGDQVVAPFDGTIVYYHRKAGHGEPRWLQTFLVLRDGLDRDWVFAHVDCSICGSQPMIGDQGTWPASARVKVAAGDPIGQVADLLTEGHPPHLHLGLSLLPIVADDGTLLPDFRAGNWARLLYPESDPSARSRTAARAAALGLIDPMPILRP